MKNRGIIEEMKNRYLTIKRVHNDVWFKIYEQSRNENLTIPELAIKALEQYIHRKKEEKSSKGYYLNQDGLQKLAQRLRIKETGDIAIMNRMIEIVSAFKFPGFDYEIGEEDYIED
jgi:hypothetical protein